MVANGVVDPRWFARIGQALDDAERVRIADAGRLHAPVAAEAVVVTSWLEAARILDAEDRDSRNWDAQEEERERLWELGCDRFTESELLGRLNAVRDRWTTSIHEAAQAAAQRAGIADPRFALEALAAALLALNHGELAMLADAEAGHPFHRTLDLFVHGRWPLGLVNGCTMIF